MEVDMEFVYLDHRPNLVIHCVKKYNIILQKGIPIGMNVITKTKTYCINFELIECYYTIF